jgi:hypothetical protein
VELLSESGGVLSLLSTDAPTSGTFTFTVPDLGPDFLANAYVRLSSGGASVSTDFVGVYAPPALADVATSATVLEKGGDYAITWTATGRPFEVRETTIAAQQHSRCYHERGREGGA